MNPGLLRPHGSTSIAMAVWIYSLSTISIGRRTRIVSVAIATKESASIAILASTVDCRIGCIVIAATGHSRMCQRRWNR